MKSTLVFLCVFTGVALGQLHHCTKSEDCTHFHCPSFFISVCKDNICSCQGEQCSSGCPCPLDIPLTAECWYGGCVCRDSNGLISFKNCHQRSDCHTVRCPPGTTSHCINNQCECKHV